MAESCLVIMPFGKTTIEKFRSWLRYEHVIRTAFRIAGIEEERVDSTHLSDDEIDKYAYRRLETAPLVLADLSGSNPNVFFELGFRKAHDKPFICISDRPDVETFYLKHRKVYDYTDPNAVANIAEAIKSAFKGLPVPSRAEDELNLLSDKIRGKKFENPFEDRVAAWRIRRASEQTDAIRQRDWELEAKRPTAYIAYLFEGFMELLEEGEEYCTVTNLNFWSDKAVGESAVLEANVKAALKGVVIKRVFLIDQNEWSSGDRLEGFMQKHMQALEKVNKVKPGNMIVKYLLTDDLGKERYGHFALARRPIGANGADDDGCVVIIPRFESSTAGTISHLKIIFSKGPSSSDMKTSEHANSFITAFSAATDLSDLKPLLATRARGG